MLYRAIIFGNTMMPRTSIQFSLRLGGWVACAVALAPQSAWCWPVPSGHEMSAGIKPHRDAFKLFVAGIPQEYSDEDLYALFHEFGRCYHAKVVTDAATGCVSASVLLFRRLLP
jgi:hypothetical protein